MTLRLASSAHRGRVGQGMLVGYPYPVLGNAWCATHRGAFARAAVRHGGEGALLPQSPVTWEMLATETRNLDMAALGERLADDCKHLYTEGLTVSRSSSSRRPSPPGLGQAGSRSSRPSPLVRLEGSTRRLRAGPRSGLTPHASAEALHRRPPEPAATEPGPEGSTNRRQGSTAGVVN